MTHDRHYSASVGNTPLIRLDTFSAETGCEILGKAEFLNPGGSVKDRAARGIIDDAERRGTLQPGGTVVEGTAGNTGIGLAQICNERGYKCIVVLPDSQSPEKYRLIEGLGAEVRIVKAVPFSDPNHYQRVAARVAEEIPGAIWSSQFDNTANSQAHFETTGPEIWAQTGGRLDAFVSSSATGGTISGVSRYLKSKREGVQVVLVDPPGSSLYEYVCNGVVKPKGSSSITEGICISRLTPNMALAQVDDALYIEDSETSRYVYRLL